MTGILFDLDGTLLDTLQDLADATNATLTHFGYPERRVEEIRNFVGNGAERLIRLALPESADDRRVQEVLDWYKGYYRAHSRVKTCPYDGVPEALNEIKGQFPVAVVSNKPDSATKDLCALYFGDVFALGENSACSRKPAPDMVYQAMAAIGADRCIYVGDSEVDVLTAKNAGVPCLSVLWGLRSKEELETAGAEHFCQRPADLLKKLKEMI